MVRTSCYIGKDGWQYEAWEHEGRTCRTMIPPQIVGDSDTQEKCWLGEHSLKMAESILSRKLKEH